MLLILFFLLYTYGLALGGLDLLLELDVFGRHSNNIHMITA